MTRFVSRFHPVYARSLVYMLQASEYHVREYLHWLARVKDFRTVERRKHIVWTAKARFLYAWGWVFSALCALLGLSAFLVLPIQYALGLLLVGMLVNAFTLPYALAAATLILQRVQAPIEQRRLRAVAKRLAAHRGLKIGIAGSFGKTSMREIVRTVLSEAKKVAAPPGSFNTPLGIEQFVSSLDGDEDVLIFELGEYYPGDVRYLSGIVGPDIGIITGVNEAHLEKFGSLKKTAETVFELAEYLGRKPLYLNAESEAARVHARRGDMLYTRENVGAWRIVSPRTDLRGTSFTMVKGTDAIRVHSKLLGLHMVGPIAVAVDIAHTLGLSTAEIERGSAKTRAFAHRMEPRVDNAGIITIDDSYNGNPDGVAAMLDFLAGLRGYRRIYVTPGLVEMGNRTEQVHQDIGRRLAEVGIERVVLIRNSVTPSIAKGLSDAGYTGELVWYDDALAAYAALPHTTVSGDIVILQNDWPDQYA